VWDHVPRVDFRTEIDNCVLDHRLRAAFPTPLQADGVHASSDYDVVDRGIGTERVVARMNEWIQANPPTSHVGEFVDLAEEGRGAVSLFDKGLPEYEARRDSDGITLLQTLFRAVRYEGGVLPKRGGAGSPIPTPDSQIQRKMVCEYALYFHTGPWDEDVVFSRANEFILPVGIAGGTVIIPGRAAGQDDALKREGVAFPRVASLVSISNPNVIMTCFKQAESGQAVVLRLFNPTESPQTADISLGFASEDVQWANLLEEQISPETNELTLIDSSHAQVTLPAKKIGSLRISLPH
jgi:alpha-mannosidase